MVTAVPALGATNVAGSVTADLYGVDFYEALDAILHANGFGYRERGNFIYVYTAEEAAQMEERQREPIVRVYHLSYVRAIDVVLPQIETRQSVAKSA